MWCEYIIYNFVRRNILILQNRQTSEDSTDLNQWYILVLGCVWIVGAERMDKTWLVYCWWHNMRPLTKTHTVKPTEASNPAMVKPLRVTWPYAAHVWCCANTCQTTQPTFSEPLKTRTRKGLLQTPPSGKLGLDWLLRGIEVGWYQGAMSHESCFCWCCLVCCTYHTCKRSTHIWKYIETCIIELCVGIRQVA